MYFGSIDSTVTLATIPAVGTITQSNADKVHVGKSTETVSLPSIEVGQYRCYTFYCDFTSSGSNKTVYLELPSPGSYVYQFEVGSSQTYTDSNPYYVRRRYIATPSDNHLTASETVYRWILAYNTISESYSMIKSGGSQFDTAIYEYYNGGTLPQSRYSTGFVIYYRIS